MHVGVVKIRSTLDKEIDLLQIVYKYEKLICLEEFSVTNFATLKHDVLK